MSTVLITQSFGVAVERRVQVSLTPEARTIKKSTLAAWDSLPILCIVTCAFLYVGSLWLVDAVQQHEATRLENELQESVERGKALMTPEQQAEADERYEGFIDEFRRGRHNDAQLTRAR